jgi:hypothetical protein
MTPSPKLVNTGEQQAIEEAAGRAADLTAERMIHNRQESSEMEKLILQHEKDCREDGPIKELRVEVSRLNGYVKGVGIALVILSLLNAWGTWFTKFGPIPLPSAAHASEAHGKGAP